MLMNESEILQDYRYAKNKFHQVRVLAELNCCKTRKMAQWLVDHGEVVDKRYFREPPKKKEETMSEEVKTQTEPEAVPPTAPNQTAKADKGKPRLTLVPPAIMFEIAKIREYGNAKYHDPDNWKQVEPQRYWDACVRHIFAALSDYTKTDDESGLLHISHAACNLAFLLQMMEDKQS